MRVAALVVACVILLLAFGGSPESRAAARAERTRIDNLPILYTPRHPDADDVPVWHELERLEFDYRWAAAESLATRVLMDSSRVAIRDSLDHAHALAYRANAVLKQRRHTDPLGWPQLERAIDIRERWAGVEDSVAIWGHLVGATFYTEAGQPERARAHGEMALAVLDSAQHALLSQAHLGLATALTAQRENDAAAMHFEDALRFRRLASGPTSHLLVAPLAEYGALLIRTGDFDGARARLQEAVRTAEAAGPGGDLLLGSLSRLSTLENRLGNVAESLELAQRGYAIAQRNFGEHALQTVFLRTIIAYRLAALGDPHGAADLLGSVVADMESDLGPQHAQTVNARLSLLEAWIGSENVEEAEHELERLRPAMSVQDPLANSNWTFFLQLEAGLQRLRGETEAARATLLSALEVERSKHDAVGEREGELLVHLFRTAERGMDRTRVQEWGRWVDVLASGSAVRSTEIWTALLLARARAEAHVGLRDLAWDRALEAEAAGRDRFSYEVMALPDAYALRLADRLGEPCELLVGLMPPTEPLAVRQTWQRVVHWRGLVRQEISRRRAPADREDPAALSLHRAWADAQRRLAQLVVAGAAHPDDPATRVRFESARREADEAERRYVRASRTSVAPAQSASLDSILAKLRPDQALVAYVVGGVDRANELGAFVAAGGSSQVRWVGLGNLDAVRGAVREWIAEIGRAPRVASDELRGARHGRAVRDLVWTPVESQLAGRSEVILVPADVLHQIPWLALPGAESAYLAEESRVLRVLSAERDLLRSKSAGATGLLAVGGSDFETPMSGNSGVASRAWRCADGTRLELPPLPFAELEAAEVVNTWPSTDGPALLLRGADATEASFKRWAPGRSVLHVATHGVLLDEDCSSRDTSSRGVGGISPLDSVPPRPIDELSLGRRVWLALAGANQSRTEVADENEGLLTAEEIALLDLRGTEWVVLSACRTGSIRAWSREGTLGMVRAFHVAGARTVIASQWSVGDESTREWMRALYATRGVESSAGAAVAAASRHVLLARRAEGRPTHPFYWAGFTASGD